MADLVRPMPLRLSLLLFALLLSSPLPARGAEPRCVRFVFTGTVTQPGGRPLPGARVVLAGAPGAAATADADGRYAFTHVVPDVAATAAPLLLVLRASQKGWNLALPSGASSLAIELRRMPEAGGGTRIEVRSNDAAVAKTVARGLETAGEAVVALDARFTRLIGREDRSAPALAALEVVTLAASPPAGVPAHRGPAGAGAGPAPRPALPSTKEPIAPPPPERPESLRLFPGAPDPVTPPATTAAAPVTAPAPRTATAAPAPASPVPPRPATADTALRPGIRVSVRPETTAAAPAWVPAQRLPEGSAGAGPRTAPEASPLRIALGRAVPERSGSSAAGADCGCRVSGTVEVRSDRPVRGRPSVVVSLAGLAAVRDTVVIFMGPPRAFDLGRVPCGRHELEIRPLSARHLVRVEPDSTGFECVAGGARQFRVVLEPR
jgi:hypothetical protein